MSKNEKSDRVGFRIHNPFWRLVFSRRGRTEKGAHVDPKRLLILDQDHLRREDLRLHGRQFLVGPRNSVHRCVRRMALRHLLNEVGELRKEARGEFFRVDEFLRRDFNAGRFFRHHWSRIRILLANAYPRERAPYPLGSVSDPFTLQPLLVFHLSERFLELRPDNRYRQGDQ
jgi:hypothetical protein